MPGTGIAPGFRWPFSTTVQASGPAGQPPRRTGEEFEVGGPPSSLIVGPPMLDDPLPPARVPDPSVLYQRGGQEISVPMENFEGPQDYTGLRANAYPTAPTPRAGSYDLSTAGFEGRLRTKNYLDALHGSPEPFDPKRAMIEEGEKDIALERMGASEGPNATPRPPLRWSERLAETQQNERRAALRQEMDSILPRQSKFFVERMREMMQTPQYQQGDDAVKNQMREQARQEAEDYGMDLESRIIARESAVAGKVPSGYFTQ